MEVAPLVIIADTRGIIAIVLWHKPSPPPKEIPMSEPKPEYKVAGVVTQNPWRCDCGKILGFWEEASGSRPNTKCILKLYQGINLVAICNGLADIPCPKCGKVRVWTG